MGTQQPRANAAAAVIPTSSTDRTGARAVADPSQAAPAGPTFQGSPALSSVIATPAAKPRRSAAMLFALAALGCAAVCFGWLYRGGDPDAGQAALGALQGLPAASSAPALPEPERIANTVIDPAQPLPGKTPASPASSGNAIARSNAPAPGIETGSEPSPAQKLVDEGTALASQGRLGLAESSFQKALRLSPEYPNAMAALVRMHIARRDGSEAVRWATRLIAKQPNNDGANKLLLGDALALRGDLAAARDAWSEAAKRGNATARQRLK
jgi:tetratricopeptide (TPR) repeat protein